MAEASISVDSLLADAMLPWCSGVQGRRELHHQATWDGLMQGWGAPSSSIRQWRTVHSSSIALASLEVKVPQMGESVSEGTIAAVLKKPGDTIKEDDVIAQIETDKVTIGTISLSLGPHFTLLDTNCTHLMPT